MEPVAFGGSRQAGALAGGVLVAVHLGDGLVAGGHGGELAVTGERHADTVGTADRGSSERRDEAQRSVDHVVSGREHR